MADTSLIWSIIARDKTSAVLEKIRATAGATGKSIAIALGGPALVPILATSTVAIASLGTALASAGGGVGVFGAVVKSTMTEVSQTATKFDDLNSKVRLYGQEAKMAGQLGLDSNKYLDKQAQAALELNARLALLPPATRDATLAYMDMKNSWQDFVDANKPATFGILASGYKLAGTAIQQLQPFFDAGAEAAKRLLTALNGAVNGGLLERMAARSGPALHTLTSIILNTATAIGRMFGRIGGSEGQSILNWLAKITAKWAAWAGQTRSDTGFSKFLAYAQANGPKVVTLLSNLVGAAINIVRATSPLAPISMAIATALAALVAALPPQVLTALVSAWLAFNVAMRLWALGSAIATAAQWAMNSALLASPITWIVLALVALGAGIYLVATKTRFFQNVWAAVWGWMKGVGAWFAGPFADFFVRSWGKITASLGRAKNQIMGVVNFIKSYYVGLWNIWSSVVSKTINAATKLVNWFRAAPGRIRGAISGMFNGLWTGFRATVNKIVAGWNNLSFGIPGFSFAGISVPGISVGTPNIPYLASGGDIRRDGLIFAHAGERITKKAQVSRTGPGAGSGRSDSPTITIGGSQAKVVRVLLELLREGIRDKGGDVVKVLTPG